MIITGTDYSLGNDNTVDMTPDIFESAVSTPHIKEAIKISKERQVHILGICHGHKMLASFFGGKVKRSSIVEDGIFKTKIVCENMLFSGLSNIFKAYKWRRWYVDQLSEELVPLAISLDSDDPKRVGSIDAWKHESLNIMGVQFHPEKSDIYDDSINHLGLRNESGILLKNWVKNIFEIQR